MAMAFDFSKIKVLTPEERAAREEAELQAQIAEDTKKREELSKRTITVTLSEFPMHRFTTSGDKIVAFHGSDERGRRFSGTYFVPYFRERSEIDAMLAPMHQGTTVVVRGYWKKRTWRNQQNQEVESWEFQIQFVEPKQG
jgi:hypothetical protein